MDPHPAHRPRPVRPTRCARTARPVRTALPALRPPPVHRPGGPQGAHAPRGAMRLLVALMGMMLVAALQMTVPAHGDPGAAMDPAGGDGAGTDASVQARWEWPMASPHRIIAPFVAPEHRYGPGHRGVDILASGAEVRAVEDGTVRFAGSVAGRGVVSILHADGLLSTYEPVTADVRAGDRVRAGQVIGELGEGRPGAGEGASHCAQACLHLGARRGGDDYVDPEPLLRGAEPSVLLPLEAVGTALALLGRHAG